MAATADKTDPKLWDAVKDKVTCGDKGGKPGQWSARKAQIAVAEYKREGGGYAGAKSVDNHLTQWTHEDWGTKSGGESLETGERYLPKKVRAALSNDEYAATTRKKRADLEAGKQFSAQPADIAKKTAAVRNAGHDVATTRIELLALAEERGITGRSRMNKVELAAALKTAQ